MAIEDSGFSQSLEAGADLSAKQFYACKLDSSMKAVLCVAGDPLTAGVNLGTPVVGEAASFGLLGLFPVVLGGTVAVGDKLTPNASGAFVKAYGADAVAGIAQEAGVSGNIITAMIMPMVSKNMGNNTMEIPITLANITAAGDVVTTMVPGFAGRILKVFFVVTTKVTTASKAVTLNLEIGTTDLTGGVVSLTSANCGTLGAVVAGSAITGNNVFSETDSISVEAASVTAFTEGEGMLVVVMG
ncbi:MAG TPA: hypothetical protein PLQ01_02075 [Methanothrix sp.]|nr:hypothetical protein [Methanothrix sp.]